MKGVGSDMYDADLKNERDRIYRLLGYVEQCGLALFDDEVKLQPEKYFSWENLYENMIVPAIESEILAMVVGAAAPGGAALAKNPKFYAALGAVGCFFFYKNYTKLHSIFRRTALATRNLASTVLTIISLALLVRVAESHELVPVDSCEGVARPHGCRFGFEYRIGFVFADEPAPSADNVAFRVDDLPLALIVFVEIPARDAVELIVGELYSLYIFLFAHCFSYPLVGWPRFIVHSIWAGRPDALAVAASTQCNAKHVRIELSVHHFASFKPVG